MLSLGPNQHDCTRGKQFSKSGSADILKGSMKKTLATFTFEVLWPVQNCCNPAMCYCGEEPHKEPQRKHQGKAAPQPQSSQHSEPWEQRMVLLESECRRSPFSPCGTERVFSQTQPLHRASCLVQRIEASRSCRAQRKACKLLQPAS